MPDPILDNLTDSQREAVTHVDGPMLVVAGAGSGKTRVVTRRIAYLIRQGIHPGNILAMTFTNKAAGEMKARVAELTGETPRWVGTFHSSCARFLRFDLDKLNEGRSGKFTIYDAADQQGLIKDCLKKLNIDDKRFKPRPILARISKAKSDMLSPDQFGEGSWDDDVIASVYHEYEKSLRGMDALDFDDLLVLTVKMLKALPDLRTQYLRKFRYILIDEYQDTNRTQYNLMKLLTGPGRNIHATGDPDQSIYSWRGADYRNIMDFQKDFPDARVVRLEQNYRSTKTILAVANEVIKNNSDRIDKTLFTENDEGEPITVASLPSDREEARWITEKLAALRAAGESLREAAVFYRTNAQSRPLEEALMGAGLPYQIVGGIRFYERKEIKDILAHLKILVNPRDYVALRRIIDCRATGVGEKTLEAVVEAAEAEGEDLFSFLAREDFYHVFTGRKTAKLKDFAAWCRRLRKIPQAPVDECVQEVLRVSGLKLEIELKSDRDPAAEDRIENLGAFVNRALEFAEANPDAALPQFLEDVALVADVDSWDREADMVSLMTLHSAKGLEFPFVFIAGLEEGLLPHGNSQSRAGLEEERRLFYVGLTRAEKKASITRASTRMTWGKIDVAAPSSFLLELPPELLEEENLASAAQQFDDFDPWDTPSSQPRFGKPKPKRNWGGLDDFSDDFGEDFHVEDEDAMSGALPLQKKSKARVSAEGLSPGDHVEHATFGRGKILSVNRTQAMIQFFVGGVRMLSLNSDIVRKI